MTEGQGLGRIRRVDLRDAWPREATDFTPWLAEHLSELADALGWELELHAQEAPVGNFSLDLLARVSGTTRTAIIENQLEQTSNDHLGKLLTYAGGYDANLVVWVAKEFRDEHRHALDWLNQHTDDDTEFFGVLVEVWSIDGSRPAPHFNVVVAPNEWRHQAVRSVRAGNRSEKSRRYEGFFQALIDTLRSRGFTTARKDSRRIGTPSLPDTRNASSTARTSRKGTGPALKSMSTTTTGTGTSGFSTGSLRKSQPSSLNCRSSWIGSGWNTAGQAASRSSAKAASKTNKSVWTRSRTGWWRGCLRSSGSSGRDSMNWQASSMPLVERPVPASSLLGIQTTQ